jgi:glucose-1-phosphate thymidylyltransferase
VRIVGVIPAAGHAVRLQPLPHSKEVLDVGGRPVMDYLVDRMRAARVDELRVVTRPEKEDVIVNAGRLGASVVLGRPATLNASFETGLDGLAPSDIALLGFPDSLWEPLDGYVRLVERVKAGADVALGLFEAPGIEGSDYLVLDDSGAIIDIDVKPKRPRSPWIWGCAAARVRALGGIAQVEWPSTHMLSLRERGVEVAAVPLSATYLDIGTPSSLERVAAVLDRLASGPSRPAGSAPGASA